MSRRTDRIARSIQVHLADLINYRLSDPRIDRMVTISRVEVSPDLSLARVRITALDAADAQMRTLLGALQHASGRLRALLGERMDLRAVPRLDFAVDEQAIRTRQTLQAIHEAMLRTPPRADPQREGPAPDGGAGTDPPAPDDDPLENSER